MKESIGTIQTSSGRVAEWLCSGLQSRVRRFNSDLGLQTCCTDVAPYRNPGSGRDFRLHHASGTMAPSPDGETGRRKGLKIPRWRHHVGSIPTPGTTTAFLRTGVEARCDAFHSIATCGIVAARFDSDSPRTIGERRCMLDSRRVATRSIPSQYPGWPRRGTTHASKDEGCRIWPVRASA